MKGSIRKYFVLLLLLVPVLASGQATVYTRSMRLADFPQKTTKVVLTGQPLLDARLKEEITSRWRISPFEFCDEAEYRAQEHGTLYYFLHFNAGTDFTWMILSKAGPTSGSPLVTALEVVSLPIASSDEATEDELIFLPAFIDIVQEYLLKSLVQDSMYYRGIAGIIHHNRKGLSVCLDREEGKELFLSGARDTIVPILIYPGQNGRRKRYYFMQVSTDNHLLYRYRRRRL